MRLNYAIGEANNPKYVTIADDNFRAFLKKELPLAFNSNDKMNANHESVKRTMDLTVTSKGITSLEGIEFFTFLTGLYCEENKLTRLDLRGVPTLKRVWCSSNQLTSLELSKSAHLETLDCSNNRLTQLDLSENTSLRLLYCQGNALVSLNLMRIAYISKLAVGVGKVVDGVEQNPITHLKINEVLKTHGWVEEAKAFRDTSITISTYRSDGILVCPDYDPISDRCNA